MHGQSAPPGDVSAAWRWCQLSHELTRRSEVSPSDLMTRIEHLDENLARVTGALVSCRAWASQLERTTQSERSSLMGWMLTMRKVGKGTGKRAPRLLAEARQLMAQSRTAVPVWILPLSRGVETFDFRRTQFDVVIIDEASQSDLLAMTALYLAKQVVIVGDHEQVSPEAVGQRLDDTQRLIDQFLTEVPNRQLYDGRASIYDFGMAAFTGLVQLREHFRCVPDIIQFSNHLSYNGTIQPLREAGDVQLRPHVVSHRVEGVRSGYTNQAEAEFITSAILAACGLDEYREATFGVISMLGDEQAKLIDRLLREHLTPAEFERRRVLTGSPPQFQGDERDVMFLSLVDSPGSGPLSMRQDESLKKRYNVAASRARDQLWVVHSLSPDHDLKPGDLRERLIRHAMNPRGLDSAVAAATAASESPFEEAVAESLVRGGYRVEAQHRVGAYRIDLVVSGNERRRVAIECDGERWHTDENLAQDLARQAQLERLGWRFIRIRGSEYYRDPDRTMERVRARLADLAIGPSGHDEAEPAPDSNELLERIIAGASDVADSLWPPDSPQDPGASYLVEEELEFPPVGGLAPIEVVEQAQASGEGEPSQLQLDVAPATVASPPTSPSTSRSAPSDEPRTNLDGLLQPYREWRSSRTIRDPRDANEAYLADVLVEFVTAEGPASAARAYRSINRAAGGQRLAKTARGQLDRAAALAVRSGRLIQANPLGAPGQINTVLRLPDMDSVVVRERGPRELDEIPPDEIAALLRQVLHDEGASETVAKRRVLELYGWKRLTIDVERYLDLCLGMSQTS